MAFKKQRVARKKVCYFTKNNITVIDYKDLELLKRFISSNGKIIPRRGLKTITSTLSVEVYLYI